MNVYDFHAKTVTGTEMALSDYKGKVLLIVNVASQCGYTPQYEGLEKLYETYKDQGFIVLGFPCNQFGSQEPGTEPEIATFCETKYGVKFPLFAKIDVNGRNAHPLFRFLVKMKSGMMRTDEGVKWNFNKFLIDRAGNPSKRYASAVKPEAIEEDIKRLLATPPQ